MASIRNNMCVQACRKYPSPTKKVTVSIIRFFEAAASEAGKTVMALRLPGDTTDSFTI